jgi:hypothetical protein
LHLLDKLPTQEQENSKLYRKTVDIEACKKFLRYIDSLPEETRKREPKTPMSQLRDQEQ